MCGCGKGWLVSCSYCFNAIINHFFTTPYLTLLVGYCVPTSLLYFSLFFFLDEGKYAKAYLSQLVGG